MHSRLCDTIIVRNRKFYLFVDAHMERTARGFIFDEDDNILLVKHASDQPWVLPGGHVESDETVYDALSRELLEEVGLEIHILGSDTMFSDEHVVSYPLPVCVHKVKYEHRKKGTIEKVEYVFFCRASSDIEEMQTEEIFDHMRVDQDEFLAMEEGKETFKFMQEILEQHQELLELL